MALIEHYLEIKQAHVALVAASGSLFAVRGAAVLAGQRWAMLAPWRMSSVFIDTLLLTAGATLWALLHLDPVQQPWLATKLLLLGLYIGLGSVALKRGRTPASRRIAYVAALLTYLFIASVAVLHHPLGVMAARGVA